MSRYWISVNVEADDMAELTEEEKEVARKLKLLGFMLNPEGGLVYKTTDETEIEIIKHKIKDVLSKTPFEFGEVVSIATQPECPKCGAYGRFSHAYCPTCGTEMTPKEYIE